MLGKNLISSVLTQVPLFIFGVAIGVFSTRILGDEGKGIFSLFQANTQLFVLIFSLGIQTGIVYFISSKKITAKIVAGMSSALFFTGCVLLISLLLFLKWIGYAHYILPKGYTSYFYIIILFIMFAITFINSIISGFFQAHSKFILLNWISIISVALNLVIFVVLYSIISNETLSVFRRFDYVLYATLISLLINFILLSYFFIRRIPIQPSFQFTLKHQLKPFIFYNLSVYIGVFINFFNYRLDLWIINSYLDDKSLSYYSLAANIVQIILFAAGAIAAVMLPNISNRTGKDRIATFLTITRISFLLFVFISFIAFIVSYWIIPIMYGAEFVKVVIPFQLLLIGIFFSCLSQLFSQLLLAENKNYLNILACSIGLVFTIVFGFILIPTWGIIGASISTTITYFVIFLFTFIFVTKYTKSVSVNLFLPSKSDFSFIKNMIIKK